MESLSKTLKQLEIALVRLNLKIEIRLDISIDRCRVEGTRISLYIVLVASLQTLFTDLQIPIAIKEDNQRAIAPAQNSIGHTRTKHIEIWFCIIRKVLAMKEEPILCGQLAREVAYSNGDGGT